MLITCQRCGTVVPDEALYCPYCNLQRPKRAPDEGGEKASQATSSAGEPKSPSLPKRTTGPIRVAAKPKRDRSSNIRFRMITLAAVVALSGVGFYVFVFPMIRSNQAEPQTVLAALDKLKRMPSNEPGLSIDARLSRDLDHSRRNGTLVGYQGWFVRPSQGTKTEVVLVFSYHETGNVLQSAEWIADLSAGTFTPQTELASTVSRQ